MVRGAHPTGPPIKTQALIQRLAEALGGDGEHDHRKAQQPQDIRQQLPRMCSAQVHSDLESLDLGANRVSFHSVAANESHRLAHILGDAAGETTETTPERKAAHG